MTTNAPQRTWLDVPYAEKDQAKAAGARWDSGARRWYHFGLSPQLERWVARPPVPEVLPGEDREFGAGLFIDLVPNSCWFTNVRSCVEPIDWARLARMVYERAAYRCELCSFCHVPGEKPWPEAHERWEYLPGYVQRLRRLVCVCKPCHELTHIGFTSTVLGGARARERLDHLKVVRGWSEARVEVHVAEAWELWESRNQHDWTLDLSMLVDAGIRVSAPPASSQWPHIEQGV